MIPDEQKAAAEAMRALVCGDAHLAATAKLRAERDAAVAECEWLREALKLCAGVLSGYDMNKRALIDALEAARAALTKEQHD